MSQQQALFAAILKLLRPLVRILLRNGVPYGAFADIAKRVYVDVAAQEFGVPGKKQTNSRISTITGLSRKEVHRVKELGDANDEGALERYNRAARVVTGWIRNSRFTNESGDPSILPFEGEGETFSGLVRMFSGDVPPRAILDELIQVGVVEQIGGHIRLLTRAYIPRTGEAEKLGILGTDVAGLIATIDHNISTSGTDPYFQRKVFYDNLPEEAIAELRALIATRAQALLEEMDHWMSSHDRDVNPSIGGTGRRASGIGIYYFEGDVPEENQP